MRYALITTLFSLIATSVWALQQDHHDHQHAEAAPVRRPKVFLDKSPRIVQFQLKRLSNAELLLVEREATDKKFAPVFEAILLRPGMARQDREQALASLTQIEQSSPVAQLLTSIASLADDPAAARVGRELATLLMEQGTAALQADSERLLDAARSNGSVVRRAALAGLMACDFGPQAARAAQQSEDAAVDFLTAISWLPQGELRGSRRPDVLRCLQESQPLAVRSLALRVLAQLPIELADSYRLAVALLDQSDMQEAAVAAMLEIPPQDRDATIADDLVMRLIADAEATPPAQRTEPPFLDRMQLLDQLLGQLPVEQSRSLRERLRKSLCAWFDSRQFPRRWRYDTPFFAVQAGRQVQVVLQNDDMMPHNFVVTRPGAMKEVGEMGSAVNNPADGLNGMQYVPRNENVLYAMPMTPAQTVQRLTFTAPDTPGEYPYVCTFPRHWMRMYGVMVVVEDLDAWLQDPVKPKDPLGNTREIVQSWKPTDFTSETVEQGLRGRSPEIGQRLFAEATCAQCHKVAGQGGAVGPELTGVLKRYQGDRSAILREILEPSHKIEPKYMMRIIQTVDGKTRSGIVVAEDKDTITIVDNPERPDPVKIVRDDIEEMVQSSVSLMPKGLLDRFTQDEIYEILSYVATESD